MDFANFIYDVFALKSDKSETCNRKMKKYQRRARPRSMERTGKGINLGSARCLLRSATANTPLFILKLQTTLHLWPPLAPRKLHRLHIKNYLDRRCFQPLTKPRINSRSASLSETLYFRSFHDNARIPLFSLRPSKYINRIAAYTKSFGAASPPASIQQSLTIC